MYGFSPWRPCCPGGRALLWPQGSCHANLRNGVSGGRLQNGRLALGEGTLGEGTLGEGNLAVNSSTISLRDRHLFGPGPKRLLALDGGGVRGAITVAFLEQIEAVLCKHLGKQE